MILDRVSRRLLTHAEAEEVARKLNPCADSAALAAQIEQLKTKPFAIETTLDNRQGQSGRYRPPYRKASPLLERLRAGRGPGQPMIVTVASYKGGAGKTTTSVHLAAYLTP